MNRGISTLKVSGGMVVSQTLAGSPQHVDRIWPGQANALMYAAHTVTGERRADVAVVQGKLLTVYFLAHQRDRQP